MSSGPEEETCMVRRDTTKQTQILSFCTAQLVACSPMIILTFTLLAPLQPIHSRKEELPEVVLIKILGHMPHHSFIQIAKVSCRFRDAWIEMKRTRQSMQRQSSSIYSNPETSTSDERTTNPMDIGNLFSTHWSCVPENNTGVNTALLKYYIENGYGNDNPKLLKKVLLSASSRGDIRGMHFMISNEYCALDDENICTMAGAAGQLKALKWLRGDVDDDEYLIDGKKVSCPWDPTDVHREAAENTHDHVLDYIEKNSDKHEIQTHYGVGLPW